MPEKGQERRRVSVRMRCCLLIVVAVMGLFAAYTALTTRAAHAAVIDMMHRSSNPNIGTTKYGTWGTAWDCTTCHFPLTTNVKMINQSIPTLNGTRAVIFTRMTASQSVANPVGVFGDDSRTVNANTSKNICEVCHHQTIYHQYSSSKLLSTNKSHENKHDCITCHVHKYGFKAFCDGCHGNPPITADTDGSTNTGLVWKGAAVGATGATNPASPGAHQKHTVDRGMRCTACHSGNGMPTVSNTIQMGFVANGTTWPGNFSGAAAYGTYSGLTPSNATYSFAAGAGQTSTLVYQTAGGRNSCNVYCHGNWNNSGKSLRPAWSGGASQTACGTCHGVSAAQPPLTGNHQKHAGSANYGFSCTKCHPNAANGANVNFAHLNGAVQWRLSTSSTGPINSGATYSGSASGSTGAVAPSGSFGQCATLYCHSDGQASPTYKPVTWNTNLPVDCSGCHGTATSDTLSGMHRQHLNPASNSALGLGNGLGCVDCHAKTVNSNTNVNAKSKHVNKFLDFSSSHGGGSARYNTGTRQCSNFYCHSNGNTGALQYVNPTAWNVITTYGCNGCHGTSNTNTGAPDYANGGNGSTTPNSHNKHVAGAGITDTRGCANCHVKTVDPATAGKFKDYSSSIYHINGTATVIFKQLGGKTGTWNGSTCSNTYCHGTAASAPWGQLTSLACNACHGANNALPGAHAIHLASATLPSKYTNYSGNVSTSGSYRFTCSSCHDKGAIHAGGPANANGAGEVFFGFTTATMKGSYTYGTTQGNDNGFNWTNGGTGCNTTYCHSNGQGASGASTVSWSTTVGSGTCSQCHGTATSDTLSGKHRQHMNPATNASLGLGNGLTCNDCHAKTASGNLALSNKSKHVNKFLDFSSSHGGGSARYNTGTKQCSNIYCHSNGNTGSLVYVNPVAWTSGTSYGCNGCHGTTNINNGSPDYPNGGVAPSTTANSHGAHVSTTADTTVCSTCHFKTASLTIAGRFKDYSAATYHLNGTPNVNFNTAKAGASAAWVQSSLTCNNVSCHFNNTAQWGASLACINCHPLATLQASGAHGKHLSSVPTLYNYTANRSSVGAYDFGCSNCHPQDKSAYHANGTVDVTLNKANSGAGGAVSALRFKNNATADGLAASNGPSGIYGTTKVSVRCSAAYCHSNGYATNLKFMVTPDWYGPAYTGDKCAMCHGNSPNANDPVNQPGSPAHYNKTFLGFANVSGGHGRGIHMSNLFTGSIGVMTAGNTATSSHGYSMTSSTISCNMCHFKTVTTSANDKNKSCVACHTAAPKNPAELIADKRNHVNGLINVDFNVIRVKSKAQLRQTSVDTTIWSRQGGYKASGAYDVAFKTFTTATQWNGSTKTCSNIACHNGKTVKWSDTGGLTNCTSCHDR